MHLAVEGMKKGDGDGEPGDNDRFAAVHRRGEAFVRLDCRTTGDVATGTQILSEDAAHEFRQVETVYIGLIVIRRTGHRIAFLETSMSVAV